MRAAALALLAALLGAACGTGRLRPDTPPGVNLSGTWILKHDLSDDPVALLDRFQRDLAKKRRGFDPALANASAVASGTAEAGASAPPTGQRVRIQRPAHRSGYARALEYQLRSSELTIEQSANRFALARGDSRRSYTPGGESVVSVVNGVADQRSGWTGREYVIDVAPLVGPRVTERFGLSSDGRQLIERISVVEKGLPKLEFTRVYERGTPTPRALPGSN